MHNKAFKRDLARVAFSVCGLFKWLGRDAVTFVVRACTP